MAHGHDYIRCISDAHVENKGKAWCGKIITGFSFVNIDHAAFNGRGGGYLVACSECTAKIIKALQEGQS